MWTSILKELAEAVFKEKKEQKKKEEKEMGYRPYSYD
jgi:hypothetical protein